MKARNIFNWTIYQAIAWYMEVHDLKNIEEFNQVNDFSLIKAGLFPYFFAGASNNLEHAFEMYGTWVSDQVYPEPIYAHPISYLIVPEGYIDDVKKYIPGKIEPNFQYYFEHRNKEKFLTLPGDSRFYVSDKQWEFLQTLETESYDEIMTGIAQLKLHSDDEFITASWNEFVEFARKTEAFQVYLAVHGEGRTDTTIIDHQYVFERTKIFMPTLYEISHHIFAHDENRRITV